MKNGNYICPICRKHTFTSEGNNDICPQCGWENDSTMNKNPSYSGGANDLCQNEFKIRYEYYVKQNPKYHWTHDSYPEIPQIEPIVCPICKKHRFEPLNWDDIYCGDKPSDVYCPVCGWHYDLEQSENHKLANRTNILSVEEYQKEFVKKLNANPNYNYYEEMTNSYTPSPHRCPVCGKYEFEDKCSYDICPYCGWEDDGSEEDFEEIGANDLKFLDYKKRYRKYTSQNPNYMWEKDGKIKS